MTVAQLEERMRAWLASGEYRGIIFEDGNEVLAYALFLETDGEIYLRQFFVVRQHRRRGVGRSAIQELLSNVWLPDKRLTVSVLVQNEAGVAFWRAMGYTDYDPTLEIMPHQRRTKL